MNNIQPFEGIQLLNARQRAIPCHCDAHCGELAKLCARIEGDFKQYNELCELVSKSPNFDTNARRDRMRNGDYGYLAEVKAPLDAQATRARTLASLKNPPPSKPAPAVKERPLYRQTNSDGSPIAF